MASLFSIAGRRRLEQLIQPGLLCAFDFDGTLAPIVMHPDRAYTPSNVIARLNELANYAKLAVITGRSVNDVHSRLGFAPDYVVGNHGLEGVPGAQEQSHYFRETSITWFVLLKEHLKEFPAFEHDIWIENKGYSLSVHYRMARDRQNAEIMLRDLFAKLIPSAKVISGKYVFNLLPQGAGDKGSAIESLIGITQSNCALYVGDDVTDEDVFKLGRPDLLSVRIGHNPRSSAEFSLSHRLDILQLLDEIITRFQVCYPIQNRFSG